MGLAVMPEVMYSEHLAENSIHSNGKTLTHSPCSSYPVLSKYYAGTKQEPYCSFTFSNNHMKIRSRSETHFNCALSYKSRNIDINHN